MLRLRVAPCGSPVMGSLIVTNRDGGFYYILNTDDLTARRVKYRELLQVASERSKGNTTRNKVSSICRVRYKVFSFFIESHS